MSREPVVRSVPPLRALRVQNLPTRIPVFPLGGALLLPRGRLPLNVFEPRYLALLDAALAGDRLFGMIQPKDGLDEEEATQLPPLDTPAALFAVGCLGRLSSFSERDDGTCSISLTGVARFRVVSELTADTPYRLLSVSYGEFTHDLDDHPPVSFDRAGLLGSLRRYFAHRGFEARWEAIEQMDDETLLTTLGMICPFPPAEKQAVLEAPTLAERAVILQTLLEMAGHEDDENGGGRSHAV